MAKDPAFLFYPGDWLGGTMGMTFEEKGAYLELLVMQWHSERITNDYAKRIVGEELWHRISHKFAADGNGFFNIRLESEKIKRRKHSEKQSINAKKRWESGNAVALPLENENINEDENVFKGGAGGKWNQRPSEKEIALELPELKIGAVVELFKISKQTDVSANDVMKFWSIFKSQNFDGEKFYQSKSKVYSHFINWCKTQNIEKNGNTHKQANGSIVKLGTSEARIKALKNW